MAKYRARTHPQGPKSLPNKWLMVRAVILNVWSSRPFRGYRRYKPFLYLFLFYNHTVKLVSAVQ